MQGLPTVRLDGTKLLATEVPHRKFSHGGDTYYVARLPEGDYSIHRRYANNDQGYGGSVVNFLMEDGTFEAVKGPFSCAGVFDHGVARKLAELMGEESIAKSLTKLTIGRNLWAYASAPMEVVFEEDEWSLTPWTDRIRPEWAGLEVKVSTRSGATYMKVDRVLVEKAKS